LEPLVEYPAPHRGRRPRPPLHVIDLPPVFDPRDAAWTVEGKVYGVVIPEGKTSGWLVPDAYRDRFEVWNGDAKELLPKMIDKVDSIDFFYHDSDDTYDHMMFEFHQAKRKLNKAASWSVTTCRGMPRCGISPTSSPSRPTTSRARSGWRFSERFGWIWAGSEPGDLTT
jgi:hypothetical protein